ncbi:MAG: hypothetical protein QOH49_1470 [Acidobacteriota bacterium]|jgi:FkbM family methyltransferase|nr:hypothetical protein [Acidobacteriota bacterium]
MNRLFYKLLSLGRGLPAPLRGLLGRGYMAYQRASRGRRVVATVDGITYQLDLGEYIDSSIYFGGCFEPDTTAAINRLCRPGMTVVDIGANVGCHALRFGKLVGAAGRVVAFEPMTWARAKLVRNIELNGFSNITVEAVALSDSAGSREAYFRSSWQSGEESDPESLRRDTITFDTLDAYAERNNISRVDLIKLDVDGHEFKVIRGGARTLAAHRPLILIELGPHLLAGAGDDIAEMVEFLSSLGYKFFDEASFGKFPDTAAVLRAIPRGDTINVVLSPEDLPTKGF